jgi:hypothetical protein
MAADESKAAKAPAAIAATLRSCAKGRLWGQLLPNQDRGRIGRFAPEADAHRTVIHANQSDGFGQTSFPRVSRILGV